MKAFAYLRVSSLGQTDGDGFTRQEIACQEYAKAHGMEIVEVFREAMTGKSDMDSRPALGELLAALEANGVKTVLIEKLDRVARDLLVQETIIGDMMRKGYTVISTMEPDLCSKDPSRVFIRQIFGAIAQLDRATIVAKTRAARERIRAKGGKCEGAKAFGEYPGEADTLAMMRRLREEGGTYAEITAHLNAKGIKARSGKEWKIPTVGKILSR